MLAYALLREGKPAQALPMYTHAATLRTPTARDLRDVAQAYVLLGDLPEADRWLMASLRMDPKSADTWYNLGRLRNTQNRFQQAVECFTEALKLSPRSVKAEDNLGLAYEGLNRSQDAEAAYRQALAWQDAGPAADASEQPFLNLAILLSHGPGSAEVGSLLQHAAAIAPNDPRIHEQLGQLSLRESKFDDAEKQLALAIALDPNRASLHFLRGQALKHLGRQQQAAAEFADAARLSQAAKS
jgi:Flp pilus assembly protein TadD